MVGPAPLSIQLGHGVGILNIANTLPQVLAPVIAGVIVTSLGYQTVFIIAMVLALVSAVVLKPIQRAR